MSKEKEVKIGKHYVYIILQVKSSQVKLSLGRSYRWCTTVLL